MKRLTPFILSFAAVCLLFLLGCKKDPCEDVSCPTAMEAGSGSETCCFFTETNATLMLAAEDDTLLMDLNEDGAVDFRFHTNSFWTRQGTGITIYGECKNSSRFALGTVPFTGKPFMEGDPLVLGNEDWSDEFLFFFESLDDSTNGYRESNYWLDPGESGYLVVRVLTADGYVPGWIKFKLGEEPSLTMEGYAVKRSF